MRACRNIHPQARYRDARPFGLTCHKAVHQLGDVWRSSGLRHLLAVLTTWCAHVGIVQFPSSYFPWLVGILLSYCLLTQLVKGWYIRRYHPCAQGALSRKCSKNDWSSGPPHGSDLKWPSTTMRWNRFGHLRDDHIRTHFPMEFLCWGLPAHLDFICGHGPVCAACKSVAPVHLGQNQGGTCCWSTTCSIAAHTLQGATHVGRNLVGRRPGLLCPVHRVCIRLRPPLRENHHARRIRTGRRRERGAPDLPRLRPVAA
jgi:hypothetical protein